MEADVRKVMMCSFGEEYKARRHRTRNYLRYRKFRQYLLYV